MVRRRHGRARRAVRSGERQFRDVPALWIERRPELVSERRRRSRGAVRRDGLELPESRHDSGGAGRRRRRVGGIFRLPGRRREHRHEVGQQQHQGRRQLFLRRRRADRQQHARRGISLQHRLPARCDVLVRRSDQEGPRLGHRHAGAHEQPDLRHRRRPGHRAQEPQLQAVREGDVQARGTRYRRGPVQRRILRAAGVARHREPGRNDSGRARPQPDRRRALEPRHGRAHVPRSEGRRHLHPRPLRSAFR